MDTGSQQGVPNRESVKSLVSGRDFRGCRAKSHAASPQAKYTIPPFSGGIVKTESKTGVFNLTSASVVSHLFGNDCHCDANDCGDSDNDEYSR